MADSIDPQVAVLASADLLGRILQPLSNRDRQVRGSPPQSGADHASRAPSAAVVLLMALWAALLRGQGTALRSLPALAHGARLQGAL